MARWFVKWGLSAIVVAVIVAVLVSELSPKNKDGTKSQFAYLAGGSAFGLIVAMGFLMNADNPNVEYVDSFNMDSSLPQDAFRVDPDYMLAPAAYV